LAALTCCASTSESLDDMAAAHSRVFADRIANLTR